MKLLVVSHTCTAIPAAQQFYAEIEQQTGWNITIVGPARWHNEYNQVCKLQRGGNFKGNLIALPALKTGNIPLHFYLASWLRLLRRVNPDFIYVHQEPYAISTFQVYLANFLTIRKPIGFFTWQNILKRYPAPFAQIERWILGQSRIMFPGSQSAQHVFQNKGYTGDSLVLPHGIDASVHFPIAQAQAIRARHNFSTDEILIGYVGRIVEEKGLKTLLQALEMLGDLPWRLVTIGSGPYESKFNDLARQMKINHKITVLGFVEAAQIPTYLTALDLVVLPSETRSNWKEQFGRVITEAIACGTPVVGSDSGEIPYLIAATGGGLVFKEGNATALAETLHTLITSAPLRNQLANQGRSTVAAHYTTSTVAASFIQAVQRVTDRASSQPRSHSKPLGDIDMNMSSSGGSLL